MSDQQSIPAQSHEPVCEHKGYRVYRTKTGFEAFKSGRRRKVGTRIDKHTGEEKDVLVASIIDRVVLPGDTVEDAIAGLDRYTAKRTHQDARQHDEHPTLFWCPKRKRSAATATEEALTLTGSIAA